MQKQSKKISENHSQTEQKRQYNKTNVRLKQNGTKRQSHKCLIKRRKCFRVKNVH